MSPRPAFTYTLLILTFLGLSNAIYLGTMTHDGEIPVCSIGALNGCGAVYTSPYSLLFGIPLSYLGVAFFSGMFIITLLLLVLPLRPLFRLAFLGSLIGFLFSLYSFYLQVFVIDAFCIYCLFSDVVTILILGVVGALQPPLQKIKPIL
jgi:uncharacterized membrane protein